MSYQNKNIDCKEGVHLNKLEKFHDLLENLTWRSKESAAEYFCLEIFPSSEYDDKTKCDCINKLANRISSANKRGCAVLVLDGFAFWFSKYFDYERPNSKQVSDCLKQIFGNPIVIESFIDACKGCQIKTDFLYISRVIHHLFSDEAALLLLRSNPTEKIFTMFGFHPVIRKHVDLQIKWIESCVQHYDLVPHCRIQNITDEAIKAVPIDVAYRFLISSLIATTSGDLKRRMHNLSPKTVEEILLLYTLAYGKNKDIELALKNIRKITKEAIYG